jgi:hypothetical protein
LSFANIKKKRAPGAFVERGNNKHPGSLAVAGNRDKGDTAKEPRLELTWNYLNWSTVVLDPVKEIDQRTNA